MQIGTGKQGVLIGEYSFYKPESPDDTKSPGTICDGDAADKNRVIGWMEPAAPHASWIIYFTQQDDAVIYRQRNMNGEVVSGPLRLAATGKNYEKTGEELRDLRNAVHHYFNDPNPENEKTLRVLMYGNIPFTLTSLDKNYHDRVVFYGPHACDKCAVLICKMGREFGTDSFDYPQGPIYPNAKWIPHVCQQADIEKVNGLRALGWGPINDQPYCGEPSPAYKVTPSE